MRARVGQYCSARAQQPHAAQPTNLVEVHLGVVSASAFRSALVMLRAFLCLRKNTGETIAFYSRCVTCTRASHSSASASAVNTWTRGTFQFAMTLYVSTIP